MTKKKIIQIKTRNGKILAKGDSALHPSTVSLLSLAKPGSNWSGMLLSNLDLSDKRENNETIIKKVNFGKSVFRQLQTTDCNLTINFINCNFNYSVFDRCDLGSVSFRNCTFHNCTFNSVSTMDTNKCSFDGSVYTNMSTSDINDEMFCAKVKIGKGCYGSVGNLLNESFNPKDYPKPSFKRSIWDPARKMKAPTDKDLKEEGFVVDKDWVYGLRTARSAHVGTNTYKVGYEYRLSAFDYCAANCCSTGLYMAGPGFMGSNYYGNNLVVVRSRKTDLLECGGKWRTRAFQVVGKINKSTVSIDSLFGSWLKVAQDTKYLSSIRIQPVEKSFKKSKKS